MGYKILGFVVWQGGKLYFRRHSQGSRRKVVMTAVAGLVLGGAIVAQRHHAAE